MPFVTALARRLAPFLPSVKQEDVLKALPYWIAATLTGLVAVLYARAIEGVTAFAAGLLNNHPWALFAWTPLCFVVARYWVLRAAPLAAGSGIPQVMAALEVDTAERPHVARQMFGKRVLFTKIGSSLVMLAGGAALGREGPMIQIAACLFHQVGKRFRGILPSVSPHAWILAGGASGIAAAFNTPLGGIVFAIEELVSPQFHKIKTSLIAAVIIAGMVAQAILGPYLYIGYPDVRDPSAMAMLFAVPMGVLAGVAGGVFGRFLAAGTSRVRDLTPKQALTFAALCGLIMAGIGWWQGDRALGGGLSLIRDYLFPGRPTPSPAMLLARGAASFVSFVAGAAGGIFAPALAIGAALGAQVDAWFPQGQHNLMVIVGMAGFLAALTQAPFTAFVLVMEMTNRHGAIFPLMVAALVASVTARVTTGPSYYRRTCDHYVARLRAAVEAAQAVRADGPAKAEPSAEPSASPPGP